MTPAAKLSLLANLPGVMAAESLRETGGAGLSAEEYKALALAATGSERMADELTRRREAKALRDAPIHGGE